MKKFFRSIATGFIIVLVCAYFFLIYDSKSFFDDPGFLWHLKDGKNIVNTFSIPYVDNFLSVTRPWISDQWFSDVILYAIYSIGDLKLIYYLFILLGIVFIFVFYRKAVLLKFSNCLASVISSFYILLLCKVHFIARPVFFSFLLMVCFLYLVEKFKEAKNKKEINNVNFYFFLLFLLYANIHPSFFMAFFIWGVFVLENFIKDFKHFEYKKFIITSSVILFATFINPYFISLHESILLLNNSEFFMSLNDEWHSIKLFTTLGLLITFTISFITLCFILSKNYRQKVGFTYFICSLVFYYYAMKHQRGVTYFSIISSIPLSVFLTNMFNLKISKKIIIIRLLPKFLKHINLYLKYDKKIYLTIFVFISLLFYHNYQNKIDFKPSINKFPYKEVSFINKNNFKGNIVASPNYGGFLIWNLNTLKPVIDDRNTLLGEKAYKDYLEAQKSLHNMYYYAIKQNAPFVLAFKKEHNYKGYFKSDAFRVLFKGNHFVLLKVKYFN